MKNYTIILFLFVLYHVNGQTVTFSKAGVCAFSGVEVMGDVYYGASTSGNGICIGKFDTLGNIISTQTYPNISSWYNYFPKMTSSVDGHLAMVLTKTDSLGNYVALVDFDTSGGIISETTISIPNISRDSISPYNLAATKDSGYIVSASLIYLGSYKLGVIKMDKNKNNQWTVLLDAYAPYYPVRRPNVYVDNDGGYLIGYQWDDCDPFTYYCQNVKCVLVKLDSVGNTVWTWVNTDPNVRLKGGNDMTRTKDGGWAVASTALSEPPNTSGISPDLQCGYVFKIDSTQNLLWEKRLEGAFYSWYDRTARIIELEDSSLVTFGTVTDSFSAGYFRYKGYVFKFSVNGDSIWSRQYYHLQQNIRHEMHDAEKLSSGGFLISGQSMGGWLLKLDEHGCLVPGCHIPLSVLPAGALENFRLSLYPNPTTDYLNMFYQSEKLGKELTFSVVDIQGKVLHSYTTMDESDKTYIVPMYDLVAGVYVLELRRDGKLVKSEKFVKQ